MGVLKVNHRNPSGAGHVSELGDDDMDGEME